MSNYTPATDFASKDSLLTGNPLKVVKGAEISAEFALIQTAITSKYDASSVVPITAGGTGATLAATALTNLGAAKSGANTDITSLGSVTTISGTPNFSGAATGVTATAGDNSTKLATTAFVSASSSPQVQSISAVANTPANGMTISAGALSLDFRASTLSSGTVTRVSGTPSNLVISSGSTLGTVSGKTSRIVVLAINNAGTIELAAVNITGGNDLSETGVITTVAEGGAGTADSANVIYSTTARTGVAYRVIGYIESTQATAGTWVSTPTTIQGAGGQVLVRPSSGSMVRLDTSAGLGSSSLGVRRFANIRANIGTDITYNSGTEASLGATFTINTSGVYAAVWSECFAAGNDFGLTLDSTTLNVAYNSCAADQQLSGATASAANYASTVQWTGYVAAGSVIRPQTTGGTGAGRIALFTIARVA